MSAADTSSLLSITPGFSDLAQGSQRVFRAALDALSRPGRIQTVRSDARIPFGTAHGAAANVLLALLDQDCTLWLSPSLASDPAAAYLRFHTGCQIVHAPEQAQFVWAANGAELPALDTLANGTEYAPEFGATCLVQVDALDDTAGWTLRGPGIRDTQRLAVQGLPSNFVAQWTACQTHFPQGVDMLLSAGDRLAGLPRTTRIED
ncbi:MAG: phosphonate C-P lyase system protein PhnH [Burkholderiaceae bacterium]|nr:phosphonate C-P lyase system protein PhnH [Burkholderiaceae bacterium]